MMRVWGESGFVHPQNFSPSIQLLITKGKIVILHWGNPADITLI